MADDSPRQVSPLNAAPKEHPAPSEPGSSGVPRTGLEAVIRRAVELSLTDADADEQISEEELIRIAGELGLTPRHVRQALYEQPVEPQEPGFLDKYFGPSNVTVVRAVPCDPQTAHGRLEDYLVTREYLQIRRRQGPNAYFEPADDAFSSIARTFSRPSSRFHLARAQKAYLSVRPLEDNWCHVRLELTFPEKRKRDVSTTVLVSGFFGTVAMGIGGLLGGVAMGGIGDAGVVVGAIVGATAGGGISVPLMLAAFRAEYRKWLGRTRDEAEALLDRLEQGDQLRPPAAPWMRRLQQKLRGFGGLR